MNCAMRRKFLIPISERRSAGICCLILTAAIFLPAETAVHADEPDLPVRGIVRPSKQAMISTDLQARVSRVAFKDGERFNKGDIIVEFDCRRQLAELASAEAQLTEMKLTLDNNLVLDKLKAVGKADVEISRTRVARAESDAEGLRVRLDACQIIAPYDGRIANLTINEHETPAPGRPFLGIIADKELEIELIAPSDWLKWIADGTEFKFTIDETKATVGARVTRIGAAVDPVSQTIKLFGTFDRSEGVLAGMSGTAEFLKPGG